MDDINFVWLIVAIVVILGFVSLQEGKGKNKVKVLLEKKGFQKIKVTTKLFTGSQGTITFEVEYCDNNGTPQTIHV